MIYFLKSLAFVLNKLPKTSWKPIPLCQVYYKYGVPIPNLVGHVTAPSVTTDATPSSITTTSAIYDTNSIDNTGGENATTRGICYVSGSGGTPTTSNTVVSTSGSYGTGNYSSTMTGLTHSTTYSVRAFATNSGGTGYGSTVEVTTLVGTPTVTTQAETLITATGFTGNGNITAIGSGNATARGIVVVAGAGTPTLSDTVFTSAGSFGTGAFTQAATGLSPSTLYTYRAYATNASGTAFGANEQVTTLSNVPPTTVLNTPADAATGQTTTPTLEFTGTDAQSDDIRYNVQVDTSSEFGAWNVTTAVYLREFSVSANEAVPSGLFFKPDGLKMYTTGLVGDTVDEYDLSTAWNVSTASYLREISVAANDISPTGLFFKPDGLKMYITGDADNSVDEYDLSTAWNVSTASYLREISVAGNETNPEDLFFKPDGTKMYTIGYNGDSVDEYDLSTAWNVTTASYLREFSVSANETNPSGLFFKEDGLKMYTIGSNGDSVDEYDLSTAWNVTTASYLREISVAANETVPTGLFFKPDGLKMYTIGSNGDTVDEYDLGSPLLNKLSGTDPGFANTVTPADTDPFNSGQKADYDVQTALTASTTYYWRVRGLDPSGSNTYGAWATTRSFTTAAAAGGGTTGYKKVYVGGAWTKKPVKYYIGGAWTTKPVKNHNGSAWVATN